MSFQQEDGASVFQVKAPVYRHTSPPLHEAQSTVPTPSRAEGTIPAAGSFGGTATHVVVSGATASVHNVTNEGNDETTGLTLRHVPRFLFELSPYSLIHSRRPSLEYPLRWEDKFPGLDAYMGRFISSSKQPLAHPPSRISDLARPTDLYIHHYGDRKLQIWLWDGDKWIGNIKDGRPHPSLKDYCLYVTEGREPKWVKRKTRTTYKGRQIREARQRALGNAAVAR